MDLELSTEQEALRDEFRRMLTAVCDHDTRRAAMDSPGAVNRELWEQLVNTGLFSLGLPEAQGGLGAGIAEMVIVHEEIGRAAVPGPVAVTSALAPHLPGVPDGSVIATALYEGNPPCIIEHLEGVDTVAMLSPTTVSLLEPSSIDALPLDTALDPLTPVHVCADPRTRGVELLTGDAAADVWLTGTLLTAAVQLGLAAQSVDMGTGYAKERMQFGRPIGSFQAVKHLLADAYSETEVARAALHSAAVGLDEDATPAESERAVAAARLLASRAAHTATRTCIQVHGGMGYTWDLDAHIYLKRTLVLDTHFDTPRAARERLLKSLAGPAGGAEDDFVRTDVRPALG